MKISFFALLFLAIFSNACKQVEVAQPPSSFYDALKKVIPEAKLVAFKNAAQDSIIDKFNDFHADFLGEYYEPDNQVVINDYFMKMGIENSLYLRSELLCFGFYYTLNERNLSPDEVQYAWFLHQINRIVNEENRRKEEFFKGERIALDNIRKCNVGEVFQLTFGTYNKTASYNGYPEDLDYVEEKDSLNIKVKLLEKNNPFSPMETKLDSLRTVFKLQILKVSSPNYMLDSKPCKVGHFFEFKPRYYGRRIENF